ncbi:MAG: protein tyrosine phosphatase, partial [Clostridium sp.]
MIKKLIPLIIIPLIILNLILFPSFSSINAFSANDPAENSTTSVKLVFDNRNITVIPSHFRKTSDIQSIANNENINTKNLETLNISGSQQFSKGNFPILIKAIDTNLPIIIFDLRQESHGFINDYAISYEGIRNAANKGLTNEQILKKEKEQLNSIKLNVPITIADDSTETIIPESVTDEHSLVTENNMKYIRIFATDEELPDSAVIDDFVRNINEIKNENRIHFHCKEGIGRTTTFMIFYDMMKNYDSVS